MPLPIAHGLVGAGVVAVMASARPAARPLWLMLLAGALLANAADLDFLLVFALGSKAWHRGFTHSLAFALLVGLSFVLLAGRRRARDAVAYGLAFASHALLDYATTREGGGVELLWPFSGERLMLGWRGLSEVPSRLPAAEVLRALAVETALFAPPLVLILLLRRAAARRPSEAKSANPREAGRRGGRG